MKEKIKYPAIERWARAYNTICRKLNRVPNYSDMAFRLAKSEPQSAGQCAIFSFIFGIIVAGVSFIYEIKQNQSASLTCVIGAIVFLLISYFCFKKCLKLKRKKNMMLKDITADKIKVKSLITKLPDLQEEAVKEARELNKGEKILLVRAYSKKIGLVIAPKQMTVLHDNDALDIDGNVWAIDGGEFLSLAPLNTNSDKPLKMFADDEIDVFEYGKTEVKELLQSFADDLNEEFKHKIVLKTMI